MSVQSEDQANNVKVDVLLPAARVKLFNVSVVLCSAVYPHAPLRDVIYRHTLTPST